MLTTTQEYAVTSEIAKTVAPHLGEPWKFVETLDADGQPTWYAEIYCGAETILKVGGCRISQVPKIHFQKSQRGRADDRIVIDGHFGDLQQFRPYNDKGGCSITVSKAKTPQQIANDIVKRLLPEYLQKWEAAYKRANEQAEYEAKELGLIARLANFANCQTKRYGTTFDIRSYDQDSLYGDVTSSSDKTVKIVLNSVPEDVAEQILGLLTKIEWRKANPPIDDDEP